MRGTVSAMICFSRTNDFLNIYLPSQAVRSACTVKTYLDGLTVFRRYVTDTRKISMKKFRFSDCTHDFLLDFMAHLRDRGCKESTCNNRLAAVKSYLWYAADGDVSLQSIALGASRVPFMKETKPIRGDHSGRGMRRNARSSQPAEEKWPAGYGDHGTSL